MCPQCQRLTRTRFFTTDWCSFECMQAAHADEIARKDREIKGWRERARRLGSRLKDAAEAMQPYDALRTVRFQLLSDSKRATDPLRQEALERTY